MTEDQKLIDEVKDAYEAKNLSDLSRKIDIPPITLSKWSNSGKIPDNGTGRQYLKLLLEVRKKDEEIELYRNLSKALKAIKEFQGSL